MVHCLEPGVSDSATVQHFAAVLYLNTRTQTCSVVCLSKVKSYKILALSLCNIYNIRQINMKETVTYPPCAFHISRWNFMQNLMNYHSVFTFSKYALK